MPTLPFFPNFSWAIIRMDTVILAKFEVRSFTLPEIIAIVVLSGVRTPNLGEGENSPASFGCITDLLNNFEMAAADIMNCYLDTLDHPRSLLCDRKYALKFHINRRDMAI